MSSIIVGQNQNEIHEILADTLAPLLAKWETAALRVAANTANPGQFAIPLGVNNDTTEAVLATHFQTLSPAKRAAVGKRAEKALSAPKTRGNLTPMLNITGLNNATSVDARLVAPGPRQLTVGEVKSVTDGFAVQNSLPKRAPLAKPFQFGTLRLDLQRIVCIDETDGFLGTERGEDEIYMMGTMLDGTSNVGSIAPFYIADFDDGTRFDFTPAKKLVSFSLNAAAVYPKGYFVTLILVEKDHGNLNQTLRDIIDKLAKEADDWLAAAIVGAIGVGGAIGGLVGAVVALAVTWAIGKIVAFLISAWEDDLFDPVTLNVIIPDSGATLTEPSKVFHFKGPGEYAVRYQWRLTRPNLVVAPGSPGKVNAVQVPRPAGGTVARKDPTMITR